MQVLIYSLGKSKGCGTRMIAMEKFAMEVEANVDDGKRLNVMVIVLPWVLIQYNVCRAVGMFVFV